MNADWRDKKLVVFDLDGTLTPSKSNLQPDMGRALARLLQEKKVAVIGGGSYKQFRKQFVAYLRVPRPLLKTLFLFPTTSTSFYVYRGGWRKIYEKKLSKTEKQKIFRAFEAAFRDAGYKHPKKTYGKIIEDRSTQVTFSALGQDIVNVLGPKEGIRRKEEWSRTPWRKKIMKALARRLPEFEVRGGGLTSIDVTEKGIDKAYGVKQIRDHLKIPVKEMLFVGDKLRPGGNDYAARRTGVKCVEVKGPEETKKVINFILGRN